MVTTGAGWGLTQGMTGHHNVTMVTTGAERGLTQGTTGHHNVTMVTTRHCLESYTYFV